MKISNQINRIIKKAEDKFGVQNHINDCISVSIYIDTDDDDDYGYQVSLSRPSQRALDYGEVNHTTSKLGEERYGFLSCNKSLVKALVELENKINDAIFEDFQP